MIFYLVLVNDIRGCPRPRWQNALHDASMRACTEPACERGLIASIVPARR